MTDLPRKYRGWVVNMVERAGQTTLGVQRNKRPDDMQHSSQNTLFELQGLCQQVKFGNKVMHW